MNLWPYAISGGAWAIGAAVVFWRARRTFARPADDARPSHTAAERLFAFAEIGLVTLIIGLWIAFGWHRQSWWYLILVPATVWLYAAWFREANRRD